MQRYKKLRKPFKPPFKLDTKKRPRFRDRFFDCGDLRIANLRAYAIRQGRKIFRPYWNAFSLRPSPLMARRDM